MSQTPAQRVLQARMAAYTLHSKVDSRAHTANARRGFLASFERKVDPDNKLAPEERLRRARAARNAHMLNLARKSAAKRSAGKARP